MRRRRRRSSLSLASVNAALQTYMGADACVGMKTPLLSSCQRSSERPAGARRRPWSRPSGATSQPARDA
eukprot:345555-Pyramimonas_sp.AAC.1